MVNEYQVKLPQTCIPYYDEYSDNDEDETVQHDNQQIN